jgi:hypothetical protein
MKLILETVLLAGAAVLSGLAEAGYYYEAATTTESAEQGASVSNVHAWIDGERAKIEFQDEAQAGMFEAGSYLLTNDAGGTIHLVNPTEKTVTEINLEQIVAMAGTVLNATGGLVKMEFNDFSSQKLAEEPGESILGYPTTRYHYQRGYTMRVSVMGMGGQTRVDTEHEFWCTDALDSAGFRVWLRPDKFQTGNSELDQMITQQYETVDCLPLRNRMVSKTTSGRGRESTTNSLTEVTQIREEAIPASTFEIPADYEMTSLADIMPTGAPPTSEQGEEQPRMPRLRDLLNR